jgi:two-component sensor histidine kinase
MSLDISNEKVLLGIDTAIPCGLVVNELLLCMIKYSFDESAVNKIKMNLSKNSDVIKISIKDNGKGIAPVMEITTVDSLSKQLIDMLVRQIDGNVNFNNDNGTCFELTFGEITYKERI